MRLKKPVGSKKSTRVKKSPRFTDTFGAVAVFLVVIGVGAAGMLLAAREPAAGDIAPAEAQVDQARVEPAAKHASASKPSPANVVSATKLAASTTPANASAPEKSAANAPAPKPAVTMTGCLERDEKTFRLKDTTGANAPKSRSWKSGFLKKGSAPIHVVDPSNTLKLSQHVGRRVRVTGVLSDREMQVSSVHRIAASCN